MEFNFNNSVTLSSVVKGAAMDLGEDFTKVEATFNHFAVRGLKLLSTELLRLGVYREIHPIHSSLRTMPIPCGSKRVLSVGIIDECGYKVPLTNKPQIAGTFEEEICVDKCPQCNQDADICENLEVTETTEDVIITDSTGTNTYTNTTTKYLEGNTYYVIKKIWVLNLVTDLAEEKTTKEFITDFDMLNCGCLAPTDENIAKVQDTCPEAYSCCYAPCATTEEDLGGYKVFEDLGIIQFDKHIPYTKAYIIYEGMLPKKNGVYHVPEVAFETLVSWIKLKYTEHKRHYGIGERDRIRLNYVVTKKNLQKVLGRMRLSDIIKSLHKMPQVNINGNVSCGTSGGSVFVQAPALVSSTPATPQVVQTVIPAPLTVVIECVVGSTPVVSGTSEAVTGISDGSLTIQSNAFINKRLRITRGNIQIPSIDPQDGSYYFTHVYATDLATLNVGLVLGEFIRIETIN